MVFIKTRPQKQQTTTSSSYEWWWLHVRTVYNKDREEKLFKSIQWERKKNIIQWYGIEEKKSIKLNVKKINFFSTTAKKNHVCVCVWNFSQRNSSEWTKNFFLKIVCLFVYVSKLTFLLLLVRLLKLNNYRVRIVCVCVRFEIIFCSSDNSISSSFPVLHDSFQWKLLFIMLDLTNIFFHFNIAHDKNLFVTYKTISRLLCDDQNMKTTKKWLLVVP